VVENRGAPGRWIVSDPTLNPGLVVICSLVFLAGFLAPWFDARQYWTVLHPQISGNAPAVLYHVLLKAATLGRQPQQGALTSTEPGLRVIPEGRSVGDRLATGCTPGRH
jgi:hypothetical protein